MMRVGAVFSQADAGTDPVAIRQWARDVESAVLRRVVRCADGWQAGLEEALELGCSDCSVGFNRMAFPGRSHAEHLDAIIGVRNRIDAIVGRPS